MEEKTGVHKGFEQSGRLKFKLTRNGGNQRKVKPKSVKKIVRSQNCTPEQFVENKFENWVKEGESATQIVRQNENNAAVPTGIRSRRRLDRWRHQGKQYP